MSAHIDLGGPDGPGRYWRVTTGEPVDHLDAHAAAVHASATGSVGCTYNGVKVERVPGVYVVTSDYLLPDVRVDIEAVDTEIVAVCESEARADLTITAARAARRAELLKDDDDAEFADDEMTRYTYSKAYHLIQG